MKPILVFISVLSLFAAAGAQPNPDTLWTRTYGGSGCDRAYSVLQTADGGYIMAGNINIGANCDFYVVKTNSLGDTVWTRTYGGSDEDWVSSAQATGDGGYLVVGSTYSFGVVWSDFYLVKINDQGDTLWTRTYGGTGYDNASSAQQTAEGGYIVVGSTDSFGAGRSDLFLMKTNGQGDTLWTRTYGGRESDGASSVQQTTDGGYVVAGTTSSFGAGDCDFYVLKISGQGDTLWTRTYGGRESDGASSVQQTTDGGFIVAGSTQSFGAGYDDLYLVKTDSLGDTLWTRTYGGSHYDVAFSVQQTADGGYIVAGYTWSFGAGSDDFYLVKINSLGDTLWTRTYGGNTCDDAFSVQRTSDGGYIVAGSTDSFGAGDYDFYVVKTGPDPTATNERSFLHPSSLILSNFPNPFNASTQIVFVVPKASRVTLTVFNLLGEEVATLADEVQSAGMHTVAFDGTGMASGVYLYRLQTEGFVQTRKMVLLK